MSNTPEYRRDPVTGRWVLIAPERAARPLALSHVKPHDRRDTERDRCPFCEGREENTPLERFAIRAPGSVANGPGWQLRVVPNKFPAVRPLASPKGNSSINLISVGSLSPKPHFSNPFSGLSTLKYPFNVKCSSRI